MSPEPVAGRLAIAPHDIDLERITLGAGFYSLDAVHAMASEDAALFFVEKHRTIHRAFRALSSGLNAPPDVALVKATVERGGDRVDSALLGQLLDEGTLAIHVTQYIERLRELAAERERFAAAMMVKASLARGTSGSAETWREVEERLARARSLRGESPPTPAAASTAQIIRADMIAPESITWLWPGRLAAGVLTNLVGIPDQGKTLIYIDLAGRITTGAAMPPDPRRPGQFPPRRVLILTHEDSLRQTAVPRLLRAQADMGQIDFVQTVKDPHGHCSMLTLADDLDALERALAATPYALFIIDGLAGYLGRDAKTHNDADVRRVLSPFVALLDRARVAGLSVMHPPKITSSVLAYYAGGSVAFSAIPRVVLGVTADPKDDAPSPRRLLGKLKGNLYGHVPTLAYHIVADGPGDVPRIQWDSEPVDVNLLDAFHPAPAGRSTRERCEHWLRDYLADGPKPSGRVESAARDAGFSLATLRRARERICDCVKTGGPGQEQRWDWLLRAKGSR